MRTMIILIILFQGCNLKDLPSEVKEIYSLNKGRDFSAFENWNVYLREGTTNVYVFDYKVIDKIDARYLIVDKDSLMFKQIFPKQDSLFYTLNPDSSYNGMSLLNVDLYLDFKSLGVDAIFYVQKNKMFLLKKDKITLVRTMKPSDSISDGVQFINYKKIDPYWFYYEDE